MAQSPMHIDLACKHYRSRSAFDELPARHLSKSYRVRRKLSAWPGDHEAEETPLQDLDRHGVDDQQTMGLDRPAAAASSLDNSLPQDPVSRLRLQRSHRSRLGRMANPSREFLMELIQVPHGRERCVKLRIFDGLASPRAAAQSSLQEARRGLPKVVLESTS